MDLITLLGLGIGYFEASLAFQLAGMIQ
jgi:hypothetical protein